MTTDEQKLERVRELDQIIRKHERDIGSVPEEVQDLWDRADNLLNKGHTHNALVLMNQAVHKLVGELETN